MIRKYANIHTDREFIRKVLDQKPKDRSIISLEIQDGAAESWSLSLYHAEPWWTHYTRSVGGVMFVPPGGDPERVSFDLFYEVNDLLDFWAKHRDGFKGCVINEDILVPLAQAKKDRTMRGKPINDPADVSEWAMMYAFEAFRHRGWFLRDEMEEAVFYATCLRLSLDQEFLDLVTTPDDKPEAMMYFELNKKRMTDYHEDQSTEGSSEDPELQ